MLVRYMSPRGPMDFKYMMVNLSGPVEYRVCCKTASRHRIWCKTMSQMMMGCKILD